MKIVLRDAQQKNLGNPLDGGFNIPNINAIVEAQVPEEEIVHRVFLDNNTIGEIGTISNASLIHRQAFLRAAWSFCDYYLGNRDIHQRIGATNDSRKTKMLNGLLGVVLEDELNNLWGNLDANTRKMIVQDSPHSTR